MRILQGEAANQIARGLGLGLATLYRWRDLLLENGLDELKYAEKGKAMNKTEVDLGRARRAIGWLTMIWLATPAQRCADSINEVGILKDDSGYSFSFFMLANWGDYRHHSI